MIDGIEQNRQHQIVLFGVLTPLIFLHTYLGVQSYYSANLVECRAKYEGEVFYIFAMMFEICMCVMLSLLIFVIMLPTWIQQARRRRRARDLA